MYDIVVENLKELFSQLQEAALGPEYIVDGLSTAQLALQFTDQAFLLVGDEDKILVLSFEIAKLKPLSDRLKKLNTEQLRIFWESFEFKNKYILSLAFEDLWPNASERMGANKWTKAYFHFLLKGLETTISSEDGVHEETKRYILEKFKNTDLGLKAYIEKNCSGRFLAALQEDISRKSGRASKRLVDQRRILF